MQAAFLIGLSVVFVTLWSSGWIASRFAVDDVSALALLTTRYLLLFVVLLFVVTIAGHWRKVSRSDITCHIFVGILSHAIYLLSCISAFEMGVSASLVTFVAALQPMITALLSAPITRERISMREWKGLLIGFLAVLLLVSEGYRHGVPLLALVLPFIAVVALSVGTLINRRINLQCQCRSRKPIPVTLILLIHSVGALGVLLPLSITTNQLKFDYNIDQWLVMLWLAIVVSLGAYAVILTLLRHMSAMRVSSLSYLVPPVTMIQAYMVFEDSISTTDLTGLIVAAVGVYFVMTKNVEKTAADLQPPSLSLVSENHPDRLHSIQIADGKDRFGSIMGQGRTLDIEL